LYEGIRAFTEEMEGVIVLIKAEGATEIHVVVLNDGAEGRGVVVILLIGVEIAFIGSKTIGR
jgi:hypothetical protein